MNRRSSRRVRSALTIALLVLPAMPTQAYITRPVQTLGHLCDSTYITVVRVENVNREKGIIVYRKVKDLKGAYPRETLRHVFDLKNTPAHKGPGDVPIRTDAKDWQYALQWAEVGKTAVVFSLKYDPYGDFGHTYIDGCWYATMCPRRDWDLWYSIYADPDLLTRWHAGSPAHLTTTIEDVLAGKDSIAPVLKTGDRDDLRAGKAKLGGLKVSVRLRDFNSQRDSVTWDGDPHVPFAATLTEAWKKAGFEPGWMRINRFGDAAFFTEPGRPADDLPAFRLRSRKEPAGLADPGVPFALDLRGSQATDDDLRRLHGLKNLRALAVAGTKVTDAGIDEIRKALPACKISR
jgi:hypothetical protein